MLNNLIKNIHPWHSCRGLKLVKGKTRYRGNQDHSRWIFHDEKNKLYYKIWNDTYVRRDNIIDGVESNFYNKTICPGLNGIIVFNGICRGYIMEEMKPYTLSTKQFYETICHYTLNSKHFFHDYSDSHIYDYKGQPCLIDLDGIHHISELQEFLDRKWHGSFTNNSYKKFVCNIVK